MAILAMVVAAALAVVLLALAAGQPALAQTKGGQNTPQGQTAEPPVIDMTPVVPGSGEEAQTAVKRTIWSGVQMVAEYTGIVAIALLVIFFFLAMFGHTTEARATSRKRVIHVLFGLAGIALSGSIVMFVVARLHTV